MQTNVVVHSEKGQQVRQQRVEREKWLSGKFLCLHVRCKEWKKGVVSAEMLSPQSALDIGTIWDDFTEGLEGGRGEWLKGKHSRDNRKKCTLMKVQNLSIFLLFL